MNGSDNFQFLNVPLDRIDATDTLTDFSIGPDPEPLESSLREAGVLHPVVLVSRDESYRVVCGHRRVRLSRKLGLTDIPARLSEPGMDEEIMLATNLMENHGHRRYSDVEKGCLLSKLELAGVPVEQIIQKYMPWVGLERSKKLALDFLAVRHLSGNLQAMLHEVNAPARVFVPLCRWEEADRDAFESVIFILRPGVNKWRDLQDLVEETAQRERCTPAAVLSGQELQTILNRTDLQPHEKYDSLLKNLTAKRFPALDSLRKQVARALDQLKLGSQTRLRINESFENDEIRIDIRFRTREQLIEQVEQLARASRSEAMDELIRILKHPEP